MYPETEISIHHSIRLDERDLFHIATEHGSIEATFSNSAGWYTIASFDVDAEHRRKGIGKELLRASLDHARSVGASYIMAAIISRECHDAMTAVFGEESISTESLGSYEQDDTPRREARTSATLWFELDS
jgi:GNAT superfamily N-acetyltransferase